MTVSAATHGSLRRFGCVAAAVVTGLAAIGWVLFGSIPDLDRSPSSSSGTPVGLSESSTAGGVHAVMDRAAPRGVHRTESKSLFQKPWSRSPNEASADVSSRGSLRIMVADAKGLPVSGEEVRVESGEGTRCEWSSGVRLVYSGDDGYAMVPGLLPGDYWVAVEGVVRRRVAVSGESRSEVALRASSKAVLEVYVCGANGGGPLTGAVVRVSNSNERESERKTSGLDGRVVFDSLNGGEVTVRVWKQGHGRSIASGSVPTSVTTRMRIELPVAAQPDAVGMRDR